MLVLQQNEQSVRDCCLKDLHSAHTVAALSSSSIACCLFCRSPKEYFAVVDSLEQKEADGRYSHFELISCKCVDTYVRVKKNQSQICWKWKKVSNMFDLLDYDFKLTSAYTCNIHMTCMLMLLLSL